ncbi:hypothetical protein ACIOJD_29960 [Streptomyces sp. NPDC088116]|uniref:hypothetical protein n=1 Tax=Streptomyces sp. NPDC088116 TaxID=3365825 RepID=UPI0037F8199B
MQLSDAPDLPHTRPHPMHWLATATAMAAVVALAGLMEPGDAKASQSGAGTLRAAAPGQDLSAPDPSGADFPLECGGAAIVVARKASGDLDGDGAPETVAAVRCDAGSGTPPSGVYVLTGASKSGPRVVATLVDPADKQSVGPDFAIRDGAVLATLLGYSGPDVPRCCPDQEERVSWQWKNGAFVRGEQPAARGM